MKVGDKVYYFEPAYYTSQKGAIREVLINGENRVNYIGEYNHGRDIVRFNKKTGVCAQPDKFYFDRDQLEKKVAADEWCGKHRYRIGKLVSDAQNIDIDVLKQIAKLVGYDDQKPR